MPNCSFVVVRFFSFAPGFNLCETSALTPPSPPGEGETFAGLTHCESVARFVRPSRRTIRSGANIWFAKPQAASIAVPSPGGEGQGEGEGPNKLLRHLTIFRLDIARLSVHVGEFYAPNTALRFTATAGDEVEISAFDIAVCQGPMRTEALPGVDDGVYSADYSSVSSARTSATMPTRS